MGGGSDDVEVGSSIVDMPGGCALSDDCCSRSLELVGLSKIDPSVPPNCSGPLEV